jgi:predicted nucleotidyltransferase
MSSPHPDGRHGNLDQLIRSRYATQRAGNQQATALPPFCDGLVRLGWNDGHSIPLKSVTCGMLDTMATPSATRIDPVLETFRQALAELYGPAIDRVVLFGSRARGDAKADSDYDVAVFLKDMANRRAEWNRLADLRVRFLDEGGPFFEAIPFRASDYQKRTPLMHEIRRDGLTL